MRTVGSRQDLGVSKGLGVDLKTEVINVDRSIDSYFEPQFGGVVIGLPFLSPNHRFERSQPEFVIGARGWLAFTRGRKSNISVSGAGRSAKIDRNSVGVALVARN